MWASISSSFGRALAKERRPLLLLSFLVLAGTIFAGTFAPPDPAFRRELERLLQEVQRTGYSAIFINNAMIGLTFFIPLLGLGSAFLTAYSTGAAMSAIAAEAGASAQVLFVSTIVMPHTLIEFLAYSLALTENLVIMQKVLSKKGLNSEVGPLVASLVIVLVLLAVGTLAEALTIELIVGRALGS